MSKVIISILFVGILLLVALDFTSINESADEVVTNEEGAATDVDESELAKDDSEVFVHPISHATFVLKLNGTTIFNDPVGEAAAMAAYGQADLVLVSDIHGDHLNVETLSAVMAEGTELVVPQAVYDELPSELQSRAAIMDNGEMATHAGLLIEAVPMYNLPTEGPDYRHVKGRGNGYVLQKAPMETDASRPVDDYRVYIAGDTEDVPEMRQLENIDMAFVPMNLPYTMGVEQAAKGVLTFAPEVVYPYHYRGPDGLADVEEFKRLVNEGNPDIEVRLADWYPE